MDREFWQIVTENWSAIELGELQDQARSMEGMSDEARARWREYVRQTQDDDGA